MGSPWKILLPLALILPLGAYVVGALASTGDEPQPRAPIQLEAPASDAEPDGASEPSTNPGQKDPKPKQKADQPRDPSGPGGDSGRGHVVPPQPYTGDDDGDDDADDDGDDDGDDDTDDD